jgi:hypothetical protein
MTPERIRRVPNTPGTPKRTIRVPNDLWDAALDEAHRRGESVTEAIVRFLRDDYTKGTK